MLCCCKKCEYKCDKNCSFLKAKLKYIKCCPMMIPDNLLNNAERYMKENEPKVYMHYIIKESGIGFKAGDLLSVLDATLLRHSYGGSWGNNHKHPKYLKITKDLGGENFECYDPFYDYKFAAFSEYYEWTHFQTDLTPDDFEDAENDCWGINPHKNGNAIGIWLFPISRKEEMLQYIETRKKMMIDGN